MSKLLILQQTNTRLYKLASLRLTGFDNEMSAPPAESHRVRGQTDVHSSVCLGHMMDHELIEVRAVGSAPDLAGLQDDEGLLTDHYRVVGLELEIIHPLQPL